MHAQNNLDVSMVITVSFGAVNLNSPYKTQKLLLVEKKTRKAWTL